MRKAKWLAVGMISLFAVLLLLGAGMMMGGWGMMKHWGYSSTPSPLGWTGTLFMWLIPVGLTVLVVSGIFWLVRNLVNSKPPSA